jgi:type II secretory pathway pseudopilin PulG
MLNFLKKQAGFSILEIVVAIFIITMGMVGVLSLITQNIQVQYINKNNLIASQLAQEGLELIRNKRDKNWLEGNDWISGITPGDYIADYTGYIGIVSGMEEAKLQERNDLGEEGYYWYNAEDSNTIFSRLITTSQTSSELLNVSCLIQWEDRGQTYQYVADTILYNWR